MKKAEKKAYWQMTQKELAAATREFDQEFIADSFSSPDRQAKARQQRAQRGRPRVGEGSVPLLVSMEKSMLRELDDFAATRKLSRSKAIAQAVKLLIKPRQAG